MSMIAPIKETASTAVPRPDLTCWDGVSASSLSTALSPPVTGCVEVDLLDQFARGVRGRRNLGRLSLTITTRSAYRQPVVKAFVDAMASRLSLSEDLCARIRTAIQEAVMNAVLHGNLGVGSGGRDSFEGLMRTHATIESMLAVSASARSVISVDATWTSKVLHVRIRDGGEGFERSGLALNREAGDAGPRASGRGLSILEAVCDCVALLDGGRTTKLGFRL